MPEQVSGYTVGDSGVQVPANVDRNVAVLRIQEGLGFRKDREITIIRRLQEAQRDLERGKTLPKFMLVEDEALVLAAQENAVDLPARFLRRSDQLIRYVPLYSTTPKRLPWKDYDIAAQAYQEYNPGGPLVVSLRQDTLHFFPTADREYTLSWSYYQRATTLEENTTNEWLEHAPEWLIGEAGLRIAKDTRNASAIQLFSDMRNSGMSAWLKDTFMDEVDDGPLLMGGNN